MYLINYATQGKFRDFQAFHKKELSPYFENIFEYNEDWLRTQSIYLKYPYIFSQKHGAGNCLWKPYIILDVLKQIPEGSLVLYSDVADHIYNHSFFKFFEETMQSREQFLTLNVFKNGDYTKRDCFIGMKCDEEKYWNHRQLEAGTCGFINNSRNVFLINEWLEYGKSTEIMTDDKSVWGEDLPGFVQTRCDQSILTNLMIKYNLPTVDILDLLKYIRYNEFD